MSQNMPNGAGICYLKNERGLFDFQSMVSDTNWSYESIRWLAFMETQPPFNSMVTIRHALNGGEHAVKIDGRLYYVDGYTEFEGRKYFFEYDGCRFHKHNCVTSLRSNIPQKDDKQRNKDLSSIGILLRTYECQWLKQKVPVKIAISNFFARKNICANEIMEAVANDSFYGIIRCDIFSPPSVIEHFSKLNHPPIFAHIQIEENMVGNKMKEILAARKVKYPLDKQLTLVFHHKQYVLTTDLAKFYMEKGMELTNLTLAIEYTRSKPLANFVETVTNKRKEATILGDNNLQNTWKLVNNSSYGRMTLNLLKRRKYKYVKPANAPTLDDNPFITNVYPVQGEFETGYMEVTEKKRNTTDKVPGIIIFVYLIFKFIITKFKITKFLILVHFGFCILQNAKLWMLKTIDVLIRYLDTTAFELVYSDTGENYYMN